jgi:hypothetical protein
MKDREGDHLAAMKGGASVADQATAADAKRELYRSVAKMGTDAIVEGEEGVVYFAGRGQLDISITVVKVPLASIAQLASVLLQTAYPDQSAIARAMEAHGKAQADGGGEGAH